MHNPSSYRDFIFRSQAEPEIDPGPPPPKDEAEEAYARIMEAARLAEHPLEELRGAFAAVAGLHEASGDGPAGDVAGASAPAASSPDTEDTGAAASSDMNDTGNPAWISIHVPEVRHDPRYADQKSSLSFTAFPKGLLRRWRKDEDEQENAASGSAASSGDQVKSRRPGFLSILLWGCLAGLVILLVSGRGCVLLP